MLDDGGGGDDKRNNLYDEDILGSIGRDTCMHRNAWCTLMLSNWEIFLNTQKYIEGTYFSDK
jgi:hypothetical protein